MKKAFAIFFFAIFSASTLYNVFVVADYFVRFDYYANVLCENKAEPTKHCNGKCQLTAELNKEKEQDAPLPELNQFKVEVFAEQQSELQSEIIFLDAQNNFKFNEFLHPQEVYFDIFAPPKSIV